MSCAYCKSDKFPLRSVGVGMVKMCFDTDACIERRKAQHRVQPPAPPAPPTPPPDKPNDN